MSRKERVTLGIIIGIICPLSLFILSGMIASTLGIYPLSNSEITLAILILTTIGCYILFLIQSWCTRRFAQRAFG